MSNFSSLENFEEEHDIWSADTRIFKKLYDIINAYTISLILSENIQFKIQTKNPVIELNTSMRLVNEEGLSGFFRVPFVIKVRDSKIEVVISESYLVDIFDDMKGNEWWTYSIDEFYNHRSPGTRNLVFTLNNPQEVIELLDFVIPNLDFVDWEVIV